MSRQVYQLRIILPRIYYKQHANCPHNSFVTSIALIQFPISEEGIPIAMVVGPGGVHPSRAFKMSRKCNLDGAWPDDHNSLIHCALLIPNATTSRPNYARRVCIDMLYQVNLSS